MPNVANQPSAAQLVPQNVHATRNRGFVDGVTVSVRTTYDRGDRSVGIRPGWDAEVDGDVELDDADEWNEAHPGVEPTREAMLALVDAASEEIGECAIEAAEEFAADDFDGPDDGYDGPEWNDREWF